MRKTGTKVFWELWNAISKMQQTFLHQVLLLYYCHSQQGCFFWVFIPFIVSSWDLFIAPPSDTTFQTQLSKNLWHPSPTPSLRPIDYVIILQSKDHPYVRTEFSRTFWILGISYVLLSDYMLWPKACTNIIIVSIKFPTPSLSCI